MDKETIWFNNLILLGFDTTEIQRKTNISFFPEMFRVANVKGMEQVVYFFLEQIFTKEVMTTVFS